VVAHPITRVAHPVPEEMPCRENERERKRENVGERAASRYRVALYAELKGYGETLWGRAQSHASRAFSSSITSLPLRTTRTEKAELICVEVGNVSLDVRPRKKDYRQTSYHFANTKIRRYFYEVCYHTFSTLPSCFRQFRLWIYAVCLFSRTTRFGCNKNNSFLLINNSINIRCDFNRIFCDIPFNLKLSFACFYIRYTFLRYIP